MSQLEKESYQSLAISWPLPNILQIEMNRPELHNAFNEVMIEELTHVFTQCENQPLLRAVVLKGRGKSFCAGADLNWMKKMSAYSREENFEDAKRLALMLEKINHCPVPVIAEAQGAALGGGVGLLSVCDYVVADEALVWGLTEVRLGLLPAVISPFVLAKIGSSWARALFLSGKRQNAELALRLGLVHETLPAHQLGQAVSAFIEELMQAGPRATREAKALIRGVLARDHNVSDVRNYTASLISTIRVSQEGQEGMGALLSKRKPHWQGDKK